MFGSFEPVDFYGFGLLALDRVCNAGDDLGAGVGSGGADRGLFALRRNGSATRAALKCHANFDAVAWAVERGIGDESEKDNNKSRYDQPDLQRGASLKKLPI